MKEWEPQQKAGHLGPSEVQVWYVNLDLFVNREAEFAALLGNEETERMRHFVFPQDRTRYTIAHGVLRKLLGGYLGEEPRTISFKQNEFGKPRLANLLNKKDIRFSLSHSAEICLAAFAMGCEVGVDVEKPRSGVATPEIAENFFARQEIHELAALHEEEREAGFFRCWTRKEAYVKGQGEGLQMPLDQFTVSLNAVGEIKLTSSDSDRWRAFDLSYGSDFFAAVFAQRPIGEVRRFRFAE
jgi:4'-phosphopantetheinyl transferase